jgi:hypothetical protein
VRFEYGAGFAFENCLDCHVQLHTRRMEKIAYAAARIRPMHDAIARRDSPSAPELHEAFGA